MTSDHRWNRHRQGLSQPTQPPIEAVDVTRDCPWTRWGILLSQYEFKMTLADLNGITRAQEESRNARTGILSDQEAQPNAPLQTDPSAAAIVH